MHSVSTGKKIIYKLPFIYKCYQKAAQIVSKANWVGIWIICCSISKLFCNMAPSHDVSDCASHEGCHHSFWNNSTPLCLTFWTESSVNDVTHGIGLWYRSVFTLPDIYQYLCIPNVLSIHTPLLWSDTDFGRCNCMHHSL